MSQTSTAKDRMTAWRVDRLGEPGEVLVFGEAAVPEPGPGEVRIRVAAAALNWSDDLVCRGRYQVKPPLPFTLGMEGTGVVDAVGAGAAWRPGERVMATMKLPHGALAEYAIAAAENVFRCPESVGDAQAAGLLIPYQTSHIALHRRGQLRAGETLLVHAGAGGMGSAAIQLGRAAGARVLATAGGGEKVALCRQLGAEIAIDYQREDFVEAVRDATDGRGADVVYDSVGGDTFDRSRRCIAFEGRILVLGFSSGRIAELPTNHALLKNYSVVGVYPARYAQLDRPLLERVHEELLQLLETGAIDPLIRLDVPLERTADAIRSLADRKTVGKVIVRVAPADIVPPGPGASER
jgi:NADPH2:quinone reductase